MNRRQSCLGLAGVGIVAQAASPSLFAAPPVRSQESPKVRWFQSLRAAHKLAIEQDVPLLIVFGASWCTYCHKMDREVFGDKRVISLIEREFIPVHLDYDRDIKVAKILEVEKLPCTVILSPHADLLAKREGYAQIPEFQKILTTALSRQAEIPQVKDSSSIR